MRCFVLFLMNTLLESLHWLHGSLPGSSPERGCVGTDLPGAGLAEVAPWAAQGRVGAWAALGISTYGSFSPWHLPAPAAEIGVATASLGTEMLEGAHPGVWGAAAALALLPPLWCGGRAAQDLRCI